MIQKINLQTIPVVIWARKHLLTLIVIATILISSLIVLWPAMYNSIPSGFVGVLYRPLSGGVDKNEVIAEGVHLTLPWNSITKYSIQTQSHTINVDLLTSDLLKTKVSLTFQFEIDEKTVPFLHKYIGPDYLENIIVPQVIQNAREAIGSITSNDAYTKSLYSMASDIQQATNNSILKNIQPAGLSQLHLLNVNSVQLSKITFPEEVEKAIEQKILDRTKAESMSFVIETAKKEAIRKKIEAEGIRDFQVTVNGGLSDNYLRYKGIEASENLAKSNNSKIVVFGSGQSGLPLIFDDYKNIPQKK